MNAAETVVRRASRLVSFFFLKRESRWKEEMHTKEHLCNNTRSMYQIKPCFHLALLPKQDKRNQQAPTICPLEEQTNTRGFSTPYSKIFAIHCIQSKDTSFGFPLHTYASEPWGLEELIKGLYSANPRNKKSGTNIPRLHDSSVWSCVSDRSLSTKASFYPSFCLRCYLLSSMPPVPPSTFILLSLSLSLSPSQTCAGASFATLSPGQRGGCGTECEVISLAWFYQSSFSPGFWTPQSNLASRSPL